MKKKLLLTVVALFTVYLCTWAQSGTCGENLTWSIQDGTLTISGTGKMRNYTKPGSNAIEAPWYEYNEEILHAEIENGVTSVGEWAFFGCSNMKSVAIPSSVTEIQVNSFSGCSVYVFITIEQPKLIRNIRV